MGFGPVAKGLGIDTWQGISRSLRAHLELRAALRRIVNVAVLGSPFLFAAADVASWRSASSLG